MVEKSALKDQAETTTLPLREIFDNNMCESEISLTFTSVARCMRKRRNSKLPPKPQSKSEFETAMSDQENPLIANYLLGCVSFLHDYGLQFGVQRALTELEIAQEIHVDGTFKTVPKPFYQLLTVHAVINDSMTPCFYALLTGKSRLLYDQVLTKLTHIIPVCIPSINMTDFELGLQAALAHASPASEIKRCYFHYSQAVWKHAIFLGMLQLIEGKDFINRWVRQLMALPLLPPDAINPIFQTQLHPGNLPDNYGNNDIILKMYGYIESFWLNKVGVETISVHYCQRRTNAEVENSHLQLLRKIRQTHPSFWVFIDKLQEKMSVTDKALSDSVDAGIVEGKEKRTKNKIRENKIDANISLLDKGRINHIEFLKRVSNVCKIANTAGLMCEHYNVSETNITESKSNAIDADHSYA